MKLFKKLTLFLLKINVISKSILFIALKAHNLSYKLAGRFSIFIEPDGLHPKHRLMKYHDWFIQQLSPDWNVLDVGSGNGALAFDLIKNCASVLAIDINQKNIERAKHQFSDKRIEYICGDATEYKFPAKYDAIVLSNVLEHIENRVDFLVHLFANQAQTKPPVLLLRVPMLTRDWITLYKKEKGVEWRLDPTHFTEFTMEQLQQELGQAGLIINRYNIQFGEFYGVVEKLL